MTDGEHARDVAAATIQRLVHEYLENLRRQDAARRVQRMQLMQHRIQDILFDHRFDMPEGVYLKLMDALVRWKAPGD